MREMIEAGFRLRHDTRIVMKPMLNFARRNGRLPLLIIVLCAATVMGAADRGRVRVSSKLYPVDEAYKNPSFAEFRERLRSAIARRDTSFLLDCVSDDIELGMDKEVLKKWSIKTEIIENHLDSMRAGEKCAFLESMNFSRRGKQLFISEWIHNGPPTPSPMISSTPIGVRRPKALTIFSTPIWDRLAKILQLGGVFVDSSLTVFRAPYLWPRWPWNQDLRYAIIDSNVVREPPKAYGEPDTARCDTLSYDLVDMVLPFEVGPSDPVVWIYTADGKCGYIPRDKLRRPVDFGVEFTFSKGRWWITRFSQYP